MQKDLVNPNTLYKSQEAKTFGAKTLMPNLFAWTVKLNEFVRQILC
jgi:hypothetical protein